MAKSDWQEWAIITVALALLSLMGCKTGSVPKGEWEFWAGSPEIDGIERRQVGAVIKCNDPKFGEFLAIQKDVFIREYNRLVNSCEQWRPGVSMVSSAHAYQQFQEATKR